MIQTVINAEISITSAQNVLITVKHEYTGTACWYKTSLMITDAEIIATTLFITSTDPYTVIGTWNVNAAS